MTETKTETTTRTLEVPGAVLTYDVRRGDSILVNVDPVVAGPLITCSIAVPGMPEKTNSGHGHTTCLVTVT